MPGLGRKREMIREGQDWTQESSGYTGGKKAKGYESGEVTGYKDGGKVGKVGKVMGTSNKRKGRTKKIKTIPMTRYKKKARRP